MSIVDSLKKIEVASIADLSVGIGKKIIIAGEEIALFKQKDGTVNAIKNSCPHKGGPLSEGIVSGEHIFCPLHDWKINLNDGKVQEPDTGCVETYKVEIVNEKIYIYVDVIDV